MKKAKNEMVAVDDVFVGCSFISARPHHHARNEEGFYVCEYSGLWLLIKGGEKQ